MIFTPLSVPGLLGYTACLTATGCAPESLQRLDRLLTSRGYTTNILKARPDTLSHGPVAPNTTMGWLLIWSWNNRNGLAECGSVWVADGVEPGTPFTLG